MASNFETPFGFWVYSVVVASMQGLTNALCYFRPYYWKRYRHKQGGQSPKRSPSYRLQEEGKEQEEDDSYQYESDSGFWLSRVRLSYVDSIFEGVIDPAVELSTFGNDSSGKTEITGAEECNVEELPSKRNAIPLPAVSTMFHESNTLSGEFLAPVIECLGDDSNGSESRAGNAASSCH
jgi:hypothetical protein